MKPRAKKLRLEARRKAYDDKLSRKVSCKRPGSFKKTGGTEARHGTGSPKQRSQQAVRARGG